MSAHLGEMKVGDSIEVKGPIQKLPYQANMNKRIGMIAGRPHFAHTLVRGNPGQA